MHFKIKIWKKKSVYMYSWTTLLYSRNNTTLWEFLLLRTQHSVREDAGLIPGLFSGLRIRHYRNDAKEILGLQEKEILEYIGVLGKNQS